MMVQNIHNWYIQDLKLLHNHEGQGLLMLKLQHLYLFFHKEIVQDLSVDFMSDSISGSFKAGLTIHIFFEADR